MRFPAISTRRLLQAGALFLLLFLSPLYTPFARWHTGLAFEGTHALLNLFDAAPVAEGYTFFLANGLRLHVVTACNFLLPYGVFALPVLASMRPLRSRLFWLIGGWGVFMGINMVRLTLITLLSAYDRAWFDWSHDLLGRGITILTVAGGVILFFLAQTRPKDRDGCSPGHAPE